ncbi:MAG: FAD-dependent oxidoreductase, partial [Pseudomonadota bacterium]
MGDWQKPQHSTYDIVIVGGAMMGSSTAFWLTKMGFQGRVLVIEMDPTYAACSTAHTNSCIRQQFSNELNIRISQTTAHFIRNIRE